MRQTMPFGEEEVGSLRARTPSELHLTSPAAAGPVPTVSSRTPLVLPGAALLALAMSLRARGLRGLDFLRRSVDRAPPTVS
ncbi:hypothetical protein [Modestobacter lapidis]|nr:hypothetical protein [Modestobacter lapidis]